MAQVLKLFLNDVLIYGVTRALAAFTGFILVPLYARVFSSAEFGVLDILLISYALLLMLSEMQISSGVMREYFEMEEEGERSALLGSALILLGCFSLIWASLGAGLLFLFSSYLPDGMNWKVFIPMLLGAFPTHAFLLFNLVYRLNREAKKVFLYSLLDVITTVSFISTSILLLNLGVEGVLWGMIVSKLIWAFVLSIKNYRHISLRYNTEYAKAILLYGMPLLPAVLAKWGQNFASRYILLLFISLSDLGVFSMAARISLVILMVDDAIRMAWEPYAMKLFRSDGTESLFVTLFNLYTASMFSFCFIVALYSDVIVNLISGGGYVGANAILAVLVMGCFWLGVSNIFASGNQWERKTWWNTVGFSVGICINILLLLLILPELGVIFAGWAYFAGAIFTAWLILHAAQKNHYIPYKKYSVIAIATASLSATAFAFWINFSKAAADMPFLKASGVAFLTIGVAAYLYLDRRNIVSFSSQISAGVRR